MLTIIIVVINKRATIPAYSAGKHGIELFVKGERHFLFKDSKTYLIKYFRIINNEFLFNCFSILTIHIAMFP